MAKIIINIREDGTVETKTEGFKGKSCLKAAKWIEEALGRILSTKKTAEYYAEDINERVKINRG